MNDLTREMEMAVETPIEAGWRVIAARLPRDLNAKAKTPLKFMFFAGARHYRAMVKMMFEIEDGDRRQQMLVNLAAELDKWETESCISEKQSS